MSILKIAFCDDELLAIEQLKTIVEEYLVINDIGFSFYEFNSGKELAETDEMVDILFLDIDMPNIDGIKAGKKYRSKNLDCKIIMATGDDEIKKEVFDITPFHYTTKPFEKDEIIKCLESAIINLHRFIGNKKITIYKNRNERVVRESKILYFKAEYGYISVKLEDEKEYYRITSSLLKMAKTVDDRLFAEASRQYLINLSFVTEIDNRKDIIYLGDEIIKLSKGQKKAFIKKMQEYDLNYRGSS